MDLLVCVGELATGARRHDGVRGGVVVHRVCAGDHASDSDEKASFGVRMRRRKAGTSCCCAVVGRKVARRWKVGCWR